MKLIQFILSIRDLPKQITSSQRLLLLMLRSHMGINGYCFPSYTTLSEECNLSRSCVIRNINKLISIGIIKIQKDDNRFKSNLYILDYQVITNLIQKNKNESKINQSASSSSTPADDSLVYSGHQTGVLKLPDWCTEATRLVYQSYPKDKIKDTNKIKIKRKTFFKNQKTKNKIKNAEEKKDYFRPSPYNDVKEVMRDKMKQRSEKPSKILEDYFIDKKIKYGK